MGKSRGRAAWTVSILTALLVFVLASGMAEGTSAPGFGGRVTLDVNPSVEMIFENGFVTDTIAYNDEGRLILKNTGLAGITAAESLQAILQEMADGGYLPDDAVKPYLLITVMGDSPDGEFTGGLADVAEAWMTQAGKDAVVAVTSLQEDVFSQAAQYLLSAGRYVMMRYIAQTQGITLDEAIAQYGATDVNTLMASFEGLEYAITGEGSGEEALEDDALVYDEEEKSAEQLLLEAQQREAAKMKREEERLLAQQNREAEMKQREEERLLAEQKREAEMKQREEERLLAEQKREAEKKQREEEQLLAQQQRDAEKKQREAEQLLAQQQREAEKKQREDEQLLAQQQRETEKKGKD